MRINSITLNNWKCFKSEVTLDFATLNIFSMPNGCGKTSVLEGILYGLYGKTEGKLENYQNHTGKTKIAVSFEYAGDTYEVERCFGSEKSATGSKKAVLYKYTPDKEEFITGISEIFEFINNFFNYEIVKILWFKGDITDSQILSNAFFKDKILKEQLKDPLALKKYYTSELTYKNREFKGIFIQNDIRDIDEIQAELDVIDKELEKRVNISDFQYNQALTSKAAHEKLQELGEVKVLDKDIIAKWKRINLDYTTQQLEQELNKVEDELLSEVGSRILSEITQMNDKHEHCVICGGKWEEERGNYIKDILHKGFKDNTKIVALREEINFKGQYTLEQIQTSENVIQLTKTANACPNWQDIIAKYQQENNQLLNAQLQLRNELNNAIRNEETKKRYDELKREIDDVKAKLDYVKDYIEKSVIFHTQQLLDKSNELLTSLNSSYSDIHFDDETGEVVVKKNTRNLPISVMSRGEKTLVAFSLIWTIRNLMLGSMPLFFDESFAALSENNIGALLGFFANHTTIQTFVVSHSKQLTERGFIGDTKIITEI